MQSTFWIRGIALASTFALAACGGSAAPASSSAASAAISASSASAKASTSASTSPAASAAASSSNAAASTKPAASSAAASGAGGGPIRIGIIEPLTGPSANIGKENREGMDLFLESVNGTIAGRKIEVTYIDGQGQPDVALTKTKQVVADGKAQILMGITNTPVCYAIAGYVKQAQVPLIVSNNCGAQSLTTDPKFKSPYLVRVTQVGSEVGATAADFLTKQGKKKVAVLASDYGGGLEGTDTFAAALVKRGGSIVQEQYPPLGTNDFGPYLGQLSQDADALMVFLPGVDEIRFGEQYPNYVSSKKPLIMNLYGDMISGTSLGQLKDKTLGFYGTALYTDAYDSAMNQAFVKAFHAKFPGRPLSINHGQGYAGGQVLKAALDKVNGNVEDKQKFLDALYATNVETVKGPIKLDQNHDVIQNVYVTQVVKANNPTGVGLKIAETYKDVGQFWDLTPEQLAKLPVGKLKGKWVGMTKDKLDALMK